MPAITAALPLLWTLLLMQDAYASHGLFSASPNYSAAPNGTVKGITAAWIAQYVYLGEVAVDGPNITVLSDIAYNAPEGSGIARLRKPLFRQMSGFAVNESGALIPVSDFGQELEWFGNFSRKTQLLFDILPPKKATLSVVGTSDFYRKEIAVYSDNHFDSATMSLPVNMLADNWSIYELQNESWADVSSVYNFSVVKRLARLSGFSPSGKVFIIEGYSPSYSYMGRSTDGSGSSGSVSANNAGSSGTSSTSSTSSTSGSAGSASVSSRGIGIRDKGIDAGVAGVAGVLQTESEEERLVLRIDAPDTVESGEFYKVSVFALSKTSEHLNLVLRLDGSGQNLSLEPFKEKAVSFSPRAPMANGSFEITAEAGNISASKRISLDFRPLRLDASNVTISGKQWISANAEVYSSGLTVGIAIYRDGETLYSDAVSDMSYSSRIMVQAPGNYTVVATATNADGSVVDIDAAGLQLVAGRYNESILPAFLIAAAYVAIAALVAVVFMSKSDR